MSDLATSSPPAPPEPTSEPKTPTLYRVLRLIAPTSPGEPERWEVMAKGVPASSAQAAIRSVATEQGNATYVAPVEKSFKPVKVTIETKTQLKLS